MRGGREQGNACKHSKQRVVPVYWIPAYPLIGWLWHLLLTLEHWWSWWGLRYGGRETSVILSRRHRNYFKQCNQAFPVCGIVSWRAENVLKKFIRLVKLNSRFKCSWNIASLNVLLMLTVSMTVSHLYTYALIHMLSLIHHLNLSLSCSTISLALSDGSRKAYVLDRTLLLWTGTREPISFLPYGHKWSPPPNQGGRGCLQSDFAHLSQ